MRSYLDFEKPVAELEAKIEELRAMQASGDAVAIDEEIGAARGARPRRRSRTSMPSSRPGRRRRSRAIRSGRISSTTSSALITEFTPLAGDRKFGEDAAIVGGFGRFRGESVCVIGHEKGSTTESRLKHNFGMARPEGYRKAVRLMEMADRFDIPVLALVDTAGAYPGIGAEERGQAEAIARSTEACLELGVPNVAVIIGEGGSGGAIAIATANRVLMLEHAIYSVISPEGAASILWRDAAKAQDAATSMKITAQDLDRVRRHRRHHPRAGRRRAPRPRRRPSRPTGEAIASALDDSQGIWTAKPCGSSAGTSS